MAEAVAMTMSQLAIISNPPPMQMPLTAAIIGFLPDRRGRPARPGASMLFTTPDLFISFHSVNTDQLLKFVVTR
jgi:hypothetical protein